jgi:hypothetical protein
MAGTNRPASPVGGGAGGATIGRDVADRQRLATVFGVGFDDAHGCRLGLARAGRQRRGRTRQPGRGDAAIGCREPARGAGSAMEAGKLPGSATGAEGGAATTQRVLGSEGRAVAESDRQHAQAAEPVFSLFFGGFALNQLPIHYPNGFSG